MPFNIERPIGGTFMPPPPAYAPPPPAPAGRPPARPLGKPGQGGTKPLPNRPPAPGTKPAAKPPVPGRPPLPKGVDLFGGSTAEQLLANPALVGKLGPSGAAKWAASPLNPANKKPALPGGTKPLPATPPPPVPTPGGPAPGTPTAAPPPNPWSPPPGSMQPPPPGAFSPGTPGAVPEPYAYNDPFSSFLAAVPMMNLNAEQQIADAMATAGFSGNRFGSWAGGKAGEIGAQNALAQNQLFLQTLADQANRSEDRALQATGLGLQTGQALDEMMRSRLTLPFGMGAWEQGRQDDFARAMYEDFEKNKLGWLPLLSQLAQSQGSGSPGQIYTTTEPGKPGAIDWLSLLFG